MADSLKSLSSESITFAFAEDGMGDCLKGEFKAATLKARIEGGKSLE